MLLPDLIAEFERTKINDIISSEFKHYLIDHGFFDVPASTKYHSSYEGGLFRHSLTVMNVLVELSRKNNLKWKRDESPFIVGMFHDLCKIDQYYHATDEDSSESWEYNSETLFNGHGIKSVVLLSQYMTLTEEEAACIVYHMGAFTPKGEWENYTRAVSLFPNVLWTHHADMIATYVFKL